MNPEQVIIEPVLTEKSNAAREEGVYTFWVDSRANKIQVKNAVAALFKVHPVDCRVVNVKAKPKRTRGRSGATAEWKKAIVKLTAGEKIGVFEGA